MRRNALHWLVFMGGVGLTCLAGCTRSSESPAPASSGGATNTPPQAARPANAYHLQQAQPKLRTITLYAGREEITAEIAATRTEIATGMMFRESMGPDEGMLFVFAMAHQSGFYMKNVTLPLSVAYMDREGVILEIHDLEPMNEEPVYAQTDLVHFVLEMNQGWFKAHDIGVGTVVTTDRGPLWETFFRRRK